MDRNKLIEDNLRLVHACAHRFEGKGIEYDDLFSAGCVGLVKAADRFDASKGFRLSTYAVPVILGEIKQLFRSGGSVKVSRSLQELSARALKVCEAYRASHDDEITIADLADRLGVDVYQAAEALSVSRTVISLSGEDGESGVDVPVPSHEEKLTEHLSLREVINALSDDERRLIIQRYYRHKTQQQTADLMGTTQVQISRREKKILLKMRAMLV